MAQVKSVCSVVQGSAVVTLAGVDLHARIKARSVFLVDVLLVPYTVAQDAVFIGGDTVVTLSGNYAGVTNAAAPGVFAVDFTYPAGIPVLSQGDVGTAAVFTEAMYRIQAILATGVTIIGATQVNADWNATSGVEKILNKPDTLGGSGAAQGNEPFDLTAFYPGLAPAGVFITRVPVARDVVFPCPLTGSVAVAGVAATNQADFKIYKNAVFFGTIRFAPGALTATFPETVAGKGVTFMPGDILSIVAPIQQDATLADVGIVLKGLR